MLAAIRALQYASAAAILLLGVLLLLGYHRAREPARGALAVAVLLLGLVSALGRASDLTGHRFRVLTDLSLVAFVGSGLGLLGFRHVFLPLSRTTRALALGFAAVAAGVAVGAHFPSAQNPSLSSLQIGALWLLIGVWGIFVGEPAVRFWGAARGRPSVQRRRLRAITLGYGGFVLILLVGLATLPIREKLPELALGFQILSLLLVPLLYASFVPPAWLRRAWRGREDEVLPTFVEGLLMVSPDPQVLAAHALEWTSDLVGADAGFIVDPTGRVLAARGLSDAEASAIGPAIGPRAGMVQLPKPLGHSAVVPLQLDGGTGHLALRTGPFAPFFGSDEFERLAQCAATISVAIGRARLVQDLARETDQYETVLRAVSDLGQGFLLAEGPRVTYANDAFCEMSGYSLQELTAMRSVLDITPEPERGLLVDQLGRRMRGEPVPDHYETTIVRKDGVHVEIEVAVKILGAGRRSHIVSIVRDVTERKSAERTLRRSYERERDAVERLKAADAMKNAFLSAVSHELRTPLTGVVGFAQTLEQHSQHLSSEEQRELAHKVVVNAAKLERLLTDLLDLDRLSRGTIEPNRRATNLRELAYGVAHESGIAGSHPIAVDAEPVVADVDSAKVERILENLIMNAVRHTPPGTPIWVLVRAERGGVLIAVEDAGPGLPPELRESIFEPFAQGPDIAKHSPGVGIGLSLVARFAELHGGRAWVEERAGGGASFRVFLPPASYSGATMTTPPSTRVS